MGSTHRAKLISISFEVVGGNRESGHAVVSTSPRMFRFLSQLFPLGSREFTFVDIGCGKGRVVVMALLHGFRRVVELRFAPLVARIAQANVHSVYGRRPGWGLLRSSMRMPRSVICLTGCRC